MYMCIKRQTKDTKHPFIQRINLASSCSCKTTAATSRSCLVLDCTLMKPFTTESPGLAVDSVRVVKMSCALM